MASPYTPPWRRSPQVPTTEAGTVPVSPPVAGGRQTTSVVDGCGDSPREQPLKDPKTGRFVKGGGGRPRGSKNKVTVQIENLLEGEAEIVTRKCIEMAKTGDPTALKIVFDRICPLRKGRVLQGLARRQGEGSLDALLRSVLEGEITPEEGKDVVSLIESAARVATAHALADMRRQQLEVLARASENGAIPGGVMLVPVLSEGQDWEAMAMESQRQLKAKVRG